MSEQFVAEYIEFQISNGKSSLKDICCQAQEEIENLDQEIKKIEKLKSRQNNLYSVVRQLGGQESKRSKKSIVIDFSVSEQDLDPYMRDFCVKICEFISSIHPNPTTPREIMDQVGNIQENKITYTALKWLLENGIIVRIENGVNRTIAQGENWESRPKACSN